MPNNHQTTLRTVNRRASNLLEIAQIHAQIAYRGGIATGTGDDRAKQMPTFVANRPWIDPPEGYISFDQEAVHQLPAISLPNTTVIVMHIVPVGYDGVITAFSWNIDDANFTNGAGQVVAQIRRNGVPIRNYNNITVEKGTPQIPRPITPIRVFSNDIVDIATVHVANAAILGNVTASLVGYDYPAES